MKRNSMCTGTWALTLGATLLYAAQTAFAPSNRLTGRYALGVLLLASLLWGAHRLRGGRWRNLGAAPPDPASLVLAGIAALGMWPVAWWLMDGTNYLLEREAGLLPRPQPITVMDDLLLGVRLAPVTYELGILFAVVLLPWLQSWLVWRLAWPELASALGQWRGAVVAGLAGGAMFTLAAAQDVAPAMPWGLASLPGYALLGLVAAAMVVLTGSPWAGFVAYASFAYASFAWRDDLFRKFVGVDYLDVRWLTIVVLGAFLALVCIQIVRFRQPPGVPRITAVVCRSRRSIWLPLALLMFTCAVMIARDLDARLERPIESEMRSQTAQE